MTKDTEELTQEMIVQAEQLIAEAERAIQETDQLYERHGIKRGQLCKFIERESANLTPDERAKLDEEARKFDEEVQLEVNQALAAAGLKKKKTRVRKGAISV